MSEIMLWDSHNKHTQVDATEPYYALLERIQTVQTERRFRLEMELIELKYGIAEEIIRSGLYTPKASGARLIDKLCHDLNMKQTTLYTAIQFYTAVQVEAGGKLEDWIASKRFDKRISWNNIRRSLSKKPEAEGKRAEDVNEFLTQLDCINRTIRFANNKIGQVLTKADVKEIKLLLSKSYGVRQKPEGEAPPHTLKVAD